VRQSLFETAETQGFDVVAFLAKLGAERPVDHSQ